MKKGAPYLLLALLAVLVLVIKGFKHCTRSTVNNNTTQVKTPRGLNRNPSYINYTKHARCRMQCRQVSEAEVTDVLKNGKINYAKSDLKGADCNKRYAVEAVSKDKQRLRIIFAPCGTEVTVITCIDLDTDWECNCDGDDKN